MAGDLYDSLSDRYGTDEKELGPLIAWISKSKYQGMAKDQGSKNWKTLGKQAAEKKRLKGLGAHYKEKYGKKE